MSDEEDVGKVVFHRGQSNSRDVWDDSALIKSYEQAMKTFRLAVGGSTEEESPPKPSTKKRKPKRRWRVGDRCQAVWSEDNEIYAAEIESIDEAEQTCVVVFSEYGNKEEVDLADLMFEAKPPKPSHATPSTTNNSDTEESNTHTAINKTTSSNSKTSRTRKETPSSPSHSSRRTRRRFDSPTLSDTGSNYSPHHGNDNHMDPVFPSSSSSSSRARNSSRPNDHRSSPPPFDRSNSRSTGHTWRSGQACRTTCCEDGLLHSATIENISWEDQTCSVYFPDQGIVQHHTPLSELMFAEARAPPFANTRHRKSSIAATPPSAPPMPPPSSWIPPSFIPSRHQPFSPSYPNVPPVPSEDDTLASMLLSWYQSGFHTGYYQAMQQMRRR
eukprot:m.159029 g.159029  ORF g.159029 m.159029 type:complete len:385 (-) comp24779_c0_seq2:20-1174(-)